MFHKTGGMIVGGPEADMILEVLKKVKKNKVGLQRKRCVCV